MTETNRRRVLQGIGSLSVLSMLSLRQTPRITAQTSSNVDLDDRHGYPESRIATAKIQNADRALDYEAYDIARELAEDAKDFANMVLEGEVSTSEDMPGFTPIAALAGLLGAGYLLARRGTDEDE